MRVGVVGINAKSSELVSREKIAKAAVKLFGPENFDLHLNFLLLSTCHRTEIYFSSHDLAESHSQILHLLRQEIDTPFEHKLYAYFGGECFSHLAGVVAGLDSVIVGETEIQGQVKRAYQNAHHHCLLPSPLHFLFQKSFKIAKEMRMSPHFPKADFSLEKVVFQLFEGVLKQEEPVLFIGNSTINRKILTYFKKKRVQNLTLCTRDLSSAQELEIEGLQLIDWQKLDFWSDFPLVICGTNQAEYLLNYQDGKEVKTRLLIDLSLPRNVDPRLGRHPQITLFNIEDLSLLLQAKERSYLQKVQLCKEELRLLAERQLSIFVQKEEIACYA